jgi:hypothetical protein
MNKRIKKILALVIVFAVASVYGASYQNEVSSRSLKQEDNLFSQPNNDNTCGIRQ